MKLGASANNGRWQSGFLRGAKFLRGTKEFSQTYAGSISAPSLPPPTRSPEKGIAMSKKMMKPGPDLLNQVNQAFLDQGYSGLSMVGLAKVCGFTQRALYYYFGNKEEAFRAMIAFRNAESVELGLEAGRTTRARGGSALDIITDILDVRYGNTRRRVSNSPHMIELNAEAFRRCRDLMVHSAISFQGALEKLVLDLQKSRLIKLNGRFTPTQIAQALADGGRAVNQALPPVASDDFYDRYRQMCEMVLYGFAVMPARKAGGRRHRIRSGTPA